MVPAGRSVQDPGAAGRSSPTRCSPEASAATAALVAARRRRGRAISAGFVAATYLRGIPYVQVPTTLLAMLDASVGGKTGVDTPHGKNLIGAFHPPAAVIADPRVLATLPERDYRARARRGGEARPHRRPGVFRVDRASGRGDLARGTRRRSPALVCRSVEIKAAVVSEDEREAGRRAILNAGHTVAHALEQASGYALAHGEAVAIGLVAECRLAESIGLAEPGIAAAVTQLLERLGLPTALPGLAAERLLEAMGTDKKNRGSRIRFALPVAIGAMARGEGWTVAVLEPARRGDVSAGPSRRPRRVPLPLIHTARRSWRSRRTGCLQIRL